MYGKKNGYTLLEIMIVIAIVAILMTITMRFGSRRIDDLNVQTIKEEFVQTYSTIFSQAMTSNYSAGKRYEKLTLLIGSGNHGFDYLFSGENDFFLSGFENQKLTITNVKLGDDYSDNIGIALYPYRMSCDISADGITGDMASFAIVVGREHVRSCFRVEHDLCKLRQVACEENSDL